MKEFEQIPDPIILSEKQQAFLEQHMLTIESTVFRRIKSTDVIKGDDGRYYLAPHKNNGVTVFDHYHDNTKVRTALLSEPGLNVTKENNTYTNRGNVTVEIALRDIFSRKGDIYADHGSSEGTAFYITVPDQEKIPCTVAVGNEWQLELGAALRKNLIPRNCYIESDISNEYQKDTNHILFNLRAIKENYDSIVGSITVEIKGNNLIYQSSNGDISSEDKKLLVLEIINRNPDIETITTPEGDTMSRKEYIGSFLLSSKI
jgi:hypothetical protein